jgi:hypothetical protein
MQNAKCKMKRSKWGGIGPTLTDTRFRSSILHFAFCILHFPAFDAHLTCFPSCYQNKTAETAIPPAAGEPHDLA